MTEKTSWLDRICNFAVLQMLVVLIAFKDYTMISIVSQCIGFSIVVYGRIIQPKKIKKSILSYLFNKIVFICVCALGMLWSFNSNNIPSIITTLFLRLMTCLTLITYIRGEDDFCRVVKYMIYGAIALCIRMVICVPFSAWGGERVGKYLSHDPKNTYGNTGVTYALGVIGVYALTCSENVIKKKKFKILLFVVFSIFSLMSGSKKQVIIVIITVVALSLLNSKSILKTLKNIIIASLVVCSFIIAIMKIQPLYNVIGVRVLAFLSFSNDDIQGVDADASTITRNYFMIDSWEKFKQNPIGGIGIDGYRYVNSYQRGTWAENNFLELLADTGIIGFLVYYSIHVMIIIHIIKKLIHGRNGESIQSFIIFLCLMVIDFTMVTYSSTTLQIYLVLLYTINSDKKLKEIENKGAQLSE